MAPDEVKPRPQDDVIIAELVEYLRVRRMRLFLPMRGPIRTWRKRLDEK